MDFTRYKRRSPQRQQFFKKFAEEIVSVWAPKSNNPVNRYVERNYETEASSYLRSLYKELNEKNEQNFINKKLKEFQERIVTIPLSLKAKEIVLSKLKKLKLYNEMTRNTNTNTNTRSIRNSTRRRSRSNFSEKSNGFSNSESNTTTNTNVSRRSSLSLQNIRNMLSSNNNNSQTRKHIAKRRLQPGAVIRNKNGRVVKIIGNNANPNTRPQATV
jgi:hypothetical protein